MQQLNFLSNKNSNDKGMAVDVAPANCPFFVDDTAGMCDIF